ncbi:transcriptional regulator [Agrococcus sp. TSP3-2-1]|uniref:transcriptional regulator n=1 Tax=Agrococcus sp. TSP3-2-1 TaxID=2804583 RepID=UPI003CEF9F0F
MAGDGADGFDEFLHSPVRLRICGLLNGVERIEFRVVRETLEITDAHLSKNVKALADAGYLAVDKRASDGRGDARRLTWLQLTSTGRRAFAEHFRALRAIAEGQSDMPAP